MKVALLLFFTTRVEKFCQYVHLVRFKEVPASLVEENFHEGLELCRHYHQGPPPKLLPLLNSPPLIGANEKVSQ